MPIDDPLQPARTVLGTVLLLADVGDVRLPEAALRIATAGVPVFPCVPGRKQPLTTHGLLDATRDRGQVAAWWRRWPDANIALPTGAVSGLVVLDIDVRTSGSGIPAFRDLIRDGPAAGWAGLVRTPSGGLHAYYPADPTRDARCWQAAAHHIDFRGDGGYVIAPPSRLSTGEGDAVRYTVARTAPGIPRHLDADGIRHRLIPRPAPTPRHPQPVTRGGDGDLDRLAGWVAARGEGERNRGLFWAACRLAETGTPAEVIQAVLGPAAERTGLPAPEIATTIRSATRTAAPAPSTPVTPTQARIRPGPAASDPALPGPAAPDRGTELRAR